MSAPDSVLSVTTRYLNLYIIQVQIVPLEPEPSMSIFAYDPFGTETTSMLFLCQIGHKQKWTP